ncbi:hypothetical protein ANN_04096 [Periplaneta americana]|uniref:Uncharacterized protein n=1 Tax=Periplaneta americana TaxID=6978 RepID=A0ABQ8T7M7_PERAM|nr:hypothetical protein ANN_04096 [Periplaneta americana]
MHFKRNVGAKKLGRRGMEREREREREKERERERERGCNYLLEHRVNSGRSICEEKRVIERSEDDDDDYGYDDDVDDDDRIYKTVILPVVLYGCEAWTLTLRAEHRFRVFENKVLRKIFGAKRDEITGGWRKLHNTELHALYSSPDIIRNIKSRRFRWAGHVAHMDESRNAYRVLVGRPEGKRLLGRPRRRWEENIKMNLGEVGYDDRDWINLAQDRNQWRAYVRAAMNLRVPFLYQTLKTERLQC